MLALNAKTHRYSVDHQAILLIPSVLLWCNLRSCGSETVFNIHLSNFTSPRLGYTVSNSVISGINLLQITC